MKKKIIYLLIFSFSFFIFLLFYKGLLNPNTYFPNKINNKNLVEFSSKNLFSGVKMNSSELILDDKFTMINIWASWCAPCRSEHVYLMNLKNNPNINLIGLNYKDKADNAKFFLNDFGNPYSNVLTDPDGTISIEIGAFGIPETYILNNKRQIIKKIMGPINEEDLNEIKLLIN